MSIVWLIAAAFLAGAVVSATVILRIAHALQARRRGGTIDFTPFAGVPYDNEESSAA